MRRRLRYLREVRELGFRDLGGLVFDQHRFQRPNEALVQGKVAAIDAIDRESRRSAPRWASAATTPSCTSRASRPASAAARCTAATRASARTAALRSPARASWRASAPATTRTSARAWPRPGRQRCSTRRRPARPRAPSPRHPPTRRPARRRTTPSREHPGRAATHTAGPGLRGLPCPRCGELLASDQDWCLRCGDPARTVIAPTPRWRLPLIALGAVSLIALGVLTAAFIALTDDDPPPPNVVIRDDHDAARRRTSTGRDAGTGTQSGPTGTTGAAGPTGPG